MFCPFCHANDTKVTNSRLVAEGMQVRRRRECLACGMRFTTYEKFEMLDFRIIKRDLSRQNFNESKLKQGVIRALEKRPVSMEQIDSLIERIKKQLQHNADREIASKIVGELVMQELKNLDEVAYIRFASVYREFKTANEFRQELDLLAKQTNKNEL